MYGAECMEAVDRRHDLSSLREDLRSAASLTEMILDSKDVELLLLKNDAQTKLTVLTNNDEKFTPPATASKVLLTLMSPGNIYTGRATCIRIHIAYIDGHMSPDTSCSSGTLVDSISAT